MSELSFLKIFFTTLVLSVVNHNLYAQDQSFESSVPSNWNSEIGSLSTSSTHYKLGSKSLQWDWAANDVLTVTNLQSNGLVQSEVLGYYENMFRMWVYNTSAISGENFEVEFYDNSGTKQFYYTFNINFTGWRAAAASYKFEMSGNKSSSNITTMKIKAPNSGSGTMHFDYIDYTMARNTYRSPDYQLPFINLDNGKHWSDMMYFQSLPKTVLAITPNSTELNDLADVKQKYDDLILGGAPSNSNVSSAISDYNNLNINYSGGIITGDPLYGGDYSNSQNVNAVDEFIHVLARDYKHKGTATSLTYFLNSIRYLLDQGFADGSLLETVHHIGYRFRNVAKAVHLMKSELETTGLWPEAQKMVEWYSAVDIIWHPTAYDSNLDDALTRSLSILGSCLYKTTDAEKVQYLKGYKLYLQNWLTTYSKEKNGLKIDFTGFHHNTYYPQYSFGAYKSLAEAVGLVSGGSYAISSSKSTVLKNALLISRVVMASNNIPNSLSGRSPLNGVSIAKGLKQLGLAIPQDAQLIEAYNYLTGGDSDTNAYGEETPPTGFWQINYANMGAYRQDNWVADAKGFSKYFWGTEIYSSDNRYGRYQSYGALEIMYAGGHSNSGFNINGWNWNMPPGTTTIHLPWSDLEAQNSRQDESTDSNFASALRFGSKSNYYIDEKLEGNFGVFAMDFTQKLITSSHNASFKFKKSNFFFDEKIICLGSNISNDDNSNVTATNLFQNALSSSSSPIIINNASVSSFPYSVDLSDASYHWILDAVNTGYYVKSGNTISIDRKSQSSPKENGNGSFTNGNFASAYINHGVDPSNMSYEYVVIPNTTSNEMTTFTVEMNDPATAFYEVIQQNQIAHIVKYNNMYGFALFEAGDFGNSTPLKSNNQPCLVMIGNVGEILNLSIVNPDLNFTSDNGPSQVRTIQLVLNGEWYIDNYNGGNVNLENNSAETTLTVETKDGLPVDIELVAKGTLSVENETIEKSIVVYPNPVQDTIYIRNLNADISIEKMTLYDALGKVIFIEKSKNDINVKELIGGIYFLKIEMKNGAEVTRKLILN